MSFRRCAGFSLIELAVVIAVVAVLSSAFVAVAVPMMNFSFQYPDTGRLGSAAADLMDIIIEGDHLAKGLRYAGNDCTLGGAGGGGDGITAASSSGSTQTLTYNYVESDYCGANASRTSHTVTLVHDSSLGTVTRSIDGGTARNIPSYVESASDINFSVPDGSTNFFKYFTSNDASMGATPLNTTVTHTELDTTQVYGAGTTITIDIPAAGVALGELLVLFFTMDGATGTVSADDTKTNTYSVTANAQAGTPSNANVRSMIIYSVITDPLVLGDVVTVTLPSVVAKAVTASKFTGVNTLDQNTGVAGSGTSSSSGNVTTTVASELLVGVIGVEGPSGDTFTPGANYLNAPPTRTSTPNGTATNNVTVNGEYRTVSATGAYPANATLGTNRDWADSIATFYYSAMARVDIDFVASKGSSKIRLKSGVDIKNYST